jgi:hypothetical protein
MSRRWTPVSRDPEEFERQCEAGLVRAAAAEAVEPRAISARYDASARTLVLQLRDGSSVVLPVSRYPEFAQLEDDVIQSVRVTASGYGLHWDIADIHLAVPVIVRSVQQHG